MSANCPAPDRLPSCGMGGGPSWPGDGGRPMPVTGAVRARRPGRGALRRAAAPRSRLALAAAMVVASLLSPGARGACAGCRDDGSPTVSAPLAAGIAPVHTAAVVADEPHRCCRIAGGPDADPAGSCCSSASPGPRAETAGRSDPCNCELAPRDEAPAAPARAAVDDLRVDAAVTGHGILATPVGLDPRPVAIGGPVLLVHARPLRVLYGVWRN